MKMMSKFCTLLLSAVLCVGMAAPAFAYGGDTEEVELPVLTASSDEEDAITVTDEASGTLTPEGNLTLVDDYHTSYSDGSGQQFITLVSKSGNTFYLVIDRNAKGENTVHFMNLVDEADLLSLMEDEDAEAYADMMLLGTYRGFELNIRFDSFKNEHQIVLRGELSYPVPLGDDPRGNIVRLDNAIGNFADRIADADAALDSLEQQKQAAEVEIAKPFAQEEELQTKSARLAELDALLNMEHQSSRTEPEAEEKPDARPSVLAALEEKADKVEPVRPFKSYLDKDGDAR